MILRELQNLEKSLQDATAFLKDLDLPTPCIELGCGSVSLVWGNDNVQCDLNFPGNGRYNLYGRFAGGPPFKEEGIDISIPLSNEILEDITEL
jgi:hypothetical protein